MAESFGTALNQLLELLGRSTLQAALGLLGFGVVAAGCQGNPVLGGGADVVALGITPLGMVISLSFGMVCSVLGGQLDARLRRSNERDARLDAENERAGDLDSIRRRIGDRERLLAALYSMGPPQPRSIPEMFRKEVKIWVAENTQDVTSLSALADARSEPERYLTTLAALDRFEREAKALLEDNLIEAPSDSRIKGEVDLAKSIEDAVRERYALLLHSVVDKGKLGKSDNLLNVLTAVDEETSDDLARLVMAGPMPTKAASDAVRQAKSSVLQLRALTKNMRASLSADDPSESDRVGESTSLQERPPPEASTKLMSGLDVSPVLQDGPPPEASTKRASQGVSAVKAGGEQLAAAPGKPAVRGVSSVG